MASSIDDFDKSDDSDEEELTQSSKALFTAERFDPLVLSVAQRQHRKVVAWRMKERVRMI